MLSHPLGISGLVGRYPTNNLVPRRPLPQRRTFAPQRLSGITRSFPRLSRTGGYVPTPYYPVCRSSTPRRELVARLACLIHAANVHSEPGSNPSIDCFAAMPVSPKRTRRAVDSKRRIRSPEASCQLLPATRTSRAACCRKRCHLRGQPLCRTVG